ncbi:MAG: hypothetical protein ACYCZF_10345 [Anaerolineae bacterium]
MEPKRNDILRLKGLRLLLPFLVGLAILFLFLSFVQRQFAPAMKGAATRLIKSNAVTATLTPDQQSTTQFQTGSIYMPLAYNGVATATPTHTPTIIPTKTRTPTPTFTPRPPGVPPPYTTSYYMSTTDYDTLYRMGQTNGSKVQPAQNVVIFLDWGQPWNENNTWGVAIFGSLEFRSTAQISTAVQAFCRGLYQSVPSNSRVTVAVGTSNYDSPGHWGRYVSREHGIAWAQMVKSLSNWIATPPSWADKITIVGAIDAEPGWNTAASTRAWADGFNQAANGSTYLNYGSCDSCPFDSCPSCKPLNGWTFEDIWYISWGQPSAFVVPEIYLPNGVNAQQWYRISLYGWTVHGQAIIFSGVLTQMQACNCPGQTNPPAEGWSQLYNLINSDFKTAYDIKWLSDISWTLR